MTATDMTAEDVVWNLEPLLPEPGEGGVLALVDRADVLADGLATARGHVGSFDAGYGSSLLARQIGDKRAREIFFLAREYSAEDAERWGVVNEVADHDRIEPFHGGNGSARHDLAGRWIPADRG